MPKYNFMISRAVDLVARKLAGMDSDTIARLTQVLSEEAQMISEELQHSGESVDSEILAARLEGVVARMKYAVRNQGPDPSPHEFPIFNVSHNPTAPYPNPINHLYDKRYKEAYSTFIKQNQPAPSTSQKNEPPTPPSPSATQPPIKPNSSSHTAYTQGPYQQQSNKQAPPPPPTQQPTGVTPPFRQQPTGGWQYVNPYATMPRSHAAYYQQQAAQMQSVQEQPTTNNTQTIRRSSTGEDFQSHPLSRSTSSNNVNYPTNSGAEKIRVRVINDNFSPSSTNAQTNPYANNRYNTQRSILKSSNDGRESQETAPTRTIYTSANTEIGTETMQDLFKVVNSQQSETASPMAERIIIIDRRAPGTPDDNQNLSGQERYRTFEIRSPTGAATPSTPAPTTATPTPSTPTTSTSSVAYGMPQPNFYTGQQLYYQQPKMYSSVPSNLYSAATPYVLGANNFFPYTYFRY